ncbi:GIY-YIG nuclease family protein [Microbacterium aerolatum]|uniref:GIY-YIG nuclease family protein n=1 Tax=Microbacterium aerolatum TaxID=153731 RepID=UPI00384CE1EE
MPWMYIVECSDGTFYTGSTVEDAEARTWAHNNLDEKAANYTRKRRPVRLVCAEEYERIEEAFAREKQVQGWSRRKKQAVIDERWDDLPELSRSATERPDASTGSATGLSPRPQSGP